MDGAECLSSLPLKALLALEQVQVSIGVVWHKGRTCDAGVVFVCVPVSAAHRARLGAAACGGVGLGWSGAPSEQQAPVWCPQREVHHALVSGQQRQLFAHSARASAPLKRRPQRGALAACAACDTAAATVAAVADAASVAAAAVASASAASVAVPPNTSKRASAVNGCDERVGHTRAARQRQQLLV
eukprot:355767-Chlamydomonas_euryale.AAC.3